MAQSTNPSDYPIEVPIPGVIVCQWCGTKEESGRANGQYPGYVQENFTQLICAACGSVSLVVADGLRLIEEGRPEMKGVNETPSSD